MIAAAGAGCGSSSSDGGVSETAGAAASTTAGPAAPNDDQIGQISPAVTGIPLSCLDPGGSDDIKQQGYVDDMIAVYKQTDPDAKFKLVPTGPNVTMRGLMTASRDALQACSQAGVSGAAQSLVDRINAVLDAN
jgi:hypothetical protein